MSIKISTARKIAGASSVFKISTARKISSTNTVTKISTSRKISGTNILKVNTCRKKIVATTSKSLHYIKDNVEYKIPLYSDIFNVGTNYISFRHLDGTKLYARLTSVGDDQESDMRVNKGNTTYSVAKSNEGFHNLSKTNLLSKYFWGSWTNVSPALTIVLPRSRTITITYDVWFFNDDGPSHVEGRVFVNSTLESCYFYQETGWHAKGRVPGTNRDSDYTVTEATWQLLKDGGYLYHQNVSQSISLVAGTHTFVMQLKGSRWERASCMKDRSISIT